MSFKCVIIALHLGVQPCSHDVHVIRQIAIISTSRFPLFFKSSFSNTIDRNNNDINIFVRFRHVKVRTMVNILKKEVAIKLHIQLASSLTSIWRSVLSLVFLVRLVELYENFPHYFIVLKYTTRFAFVNKKGIKFYICYLQYLLQRNTFSSNFCPPLPVPLPDLFHCPCLLPSYCLA